MDFYSMSEYPIGMGVFVEASDGGSLLREAHLRALVQFDSYIRTKLVVTGEDGDPFGYEDFCRPRCAMNGAMQKIMVGVRDFAIRCVNFFNF